MGHEKSQNSRAASGVAPSDPPRLLTLKRGLTAWGKPMPALLRLVGFGLIVFTSVLLVSNSKAKVEDTMNHRVAARVFAATSGRNSPNSASRVN